jgi:DNA-binding NarL/FixJ family response regulator
MPAFEPSLIATSDSELARTLSGLLGGSSVIAPSFRIALAQIRTAQPRNILIDSQLDGGDAISLGLVIQRHCPLALSVLLHHHTRWVSQEAAIALGFNYLLDRNLSGQELSRQITKAISQPRKLEKSLLGSLSQREQEIFSHLEQGLRNVEIAEHFEISLATIKTHLSSIYRKLGVRNRVEAIAKVRA